jgi:hypothetical protein
MRHIRRSILDKHSVTSVLALPIVVLEASLELVLVLGPRHPQ